MGKDLSRTTLMQQDYYVNLQREFYEASKNHSGGISTLPSSPFVGV